MEMDYVKLVGAAKHLLQEQNVMRHLVHAVLVQAQGAWARGYFPHVIFTESGTSFGPREGRGMRWGSGSPPLIPR
jgi:hypothetical protein